LFPSRSLFGADLAIAAARRTDPTRMTDDATPIVIDGNLDEAIWRDLTQITDFVVVEADTLQKPPHATLVRLFYTSRRPYLVGRQNRSAPTLCNGSASGHVGS
jgi:hypothetical protein